MPVPVRPWDYWPVSAGRTGTVLGLNGCARRPYQYGAGFQRVNDVSHVDWDNYHSDSVPTYCNIFNAITMIGAPICKAGWFCWKSTLATNHLQSIWWCWVLISCYVVLYCPPSPFSWWHLNRLQTLVNKHDNHNTQQLILLLLTFQILFLIIVDICFIYIYCAKVICVFRSILSNENALSSMRCFSWATTCWNFVVENCFSIFWSITPFPNTNVVVVLQQLKAFKKCSSVSLNQFLRFANHYRGHPFSKYAPKALVSPANAYAPY